MIPETEFNFLTTSSPPDIVVICGPTGIGKTALAIELAGEFHGEIVSADSMQIYRYMDIGTAKPTQEELSLIPHHLIDIADPDEDFDAAIYTRLAREKINQLHERGIVPFVVGGTGFYIKALIHGIFQTAPTVHDIRARLKKEAEEKGTGFIYKRLCQADPEAAEKIHPNDAYRIIRAIEIFEITGKPISEYQQAHGFEENPFNVLKIALHTERERLYERINRRVDAMIAEGFVDEVRKLLAMGYKPDLKAMQSIGYRHIIDFLNEKFSWDETVRLLKRDTRRYSKRQITWFKADPEMVWIEPEKYNDIRQLISSFLSHVGWW